MSTDIKEVVKQKYGQAALRVHTGGSSCCGASAATDACCDPITMNLYNDTQASQVPEGALKASLGCGNPTLLAQLNPGETVLDLGAGGESWDGTSERLTDCNVRDEGYHRFLMMLMRDRQEYVEALDIYEIRFQMALQ